MTDPQEKNDEAPRTLRTYQSDVEDILKGGKGSLATIAVAESKRNAGKEFLEEHKPRKSIQSKILIWASVGLVIAGIGLVLYFYANRAANSGALPASRSLIEANKVKEINVSLLSRGQVINLLQKEREINEAPLSSVTSIKFFEGTGETKKELALKDFFLKLESRAPNSLIRSLADNFLFGFYSFNQNYPFLILKVSYYQNAFAGMLEWEENMRGDIGLLFFDEVLPSDVFTAEQFLNQKGGFEDLLIKNRDARILRSEDGSIKFLYSFPDKDTIIITANAKTLEEVAKRLFANRLVQ